MTNLEWKMCEFCYDCENRRTGSFTDSGGAYYTYASYCECMGIVFDGMSFEDIARAVEENACMEV